MADYQKFISPNEKILQAFGMANSQFIFDLVIGVILIPVILGVFQIVWTIYTKFSLVYIITDKRVVIKKGLIGQSTVSTDYSKITDVSVDQGIIGRTLLHTGTISLDTAGTDQEELVLRWVSEPFKVKDLIYQHMHK